MLLIIICRYDVFTPQDAGESSVANIDKLRHANGNITPAALRLKMQKVISFLTQPRLCAVRLR